VNDDIRAFFGKVQSHSSAEAFRGASNEHDPASEGFHPNC
jgi:hypothetical protein